MSIQPVRAKDLTASLGLPADAAVTNSTSNGSIIAVLKATLREIMARLPALVGGRIPTTSQGRVAGGVTYASVAVPITSGVLFAANANRIGWWTQNLGANEVYNCEGATATTTTGMVLPPDFERDSEYIFAGVINAIALTAVTNISTADYTN